MKPQDLYINNVKLKKLLFLLAFLNVFDGLITLYFLNHRFAEEVNPIMNWAYSQSEVIFAATKILLVGTGLTVLWVFSHFTKYPKALMAIVIALAIGFLALISYESFFLVKTIAFSLNSCHN